MQCTDTLAHVYTHTWHTAGQVVSWEWAVDLVGLACAEVLDDGLELLAFHEIFFRLP